MTAEPTLRDRLDDVEDLQALVVALMHRVDALEAGPHGSVWVVMHEMEPLAVVRTEAEAETVVTQLLLPGQPRNRATSYWRKLAVSGS